MQGACVFYLYFPTSHIPSPPAKHVDKVNVETPLLGKKNYYPQNGFFQTSTSFVHLMHIAPCSLVITVLIKTPPLGFFCVFSPPSALTVRVKVNKDVFFTQVLLSVCYLFAIFFTAFFFFNFLF